MKSAEEILALVDVGVAIPLTLLMNFSLFQYLLTTFWRRRQERRVRLLLFVALISCLALIPFAYPDRALGRNLNDVSEVCSVLTFLMQITILTRDVSKRIKIRSLRVLLWCGESLVIASVMVLLANVVDMFAPVIDYELVELLDNIVEHAALVYIVAFRFYFLAMAKGYAKVWATQKTEMSHYLLFLLHEVPFHLLEHYTHLDWHHIQALWMRTTIVLCLSTTVRARLSSLGSKKGPTTTNAGPVISSFDQVSRVPTRHKSADEQATPVVPWRKPSVVRSAVAVAPKK